MTAEDPRVPLNPVRRMLRQASGRYTSKFALGGREKRHLRPTPSLPKLKCLELPPLILEEERR